ncbi:MAG: hypothetical protein J5871_00400 [Bacteroidales bacterium]|nr:hypothetical protein [Bacteroidales bacterium]
MKRLLLPWAAGLLSLLSSACLREEAQPAAERLRIGIACCIQESKAPEPDKRPWGFAGETKGSPTGNGQLAGPVACAGFVYNGKNWFKEFDDFFTQESDGLWQSGGCYYYAGARIRFRYFHPADCCEARSSGADWILSYRPGANTTDDFNLRRDATYTISLGLGAGGIAEATQQSWWKVSFSGQVHHMSYRWTAPFREQEGFFSDLDLQNSILLDQFFCNAATSLQASLCPYEFDGNGKSCGKPTPVVLGTGNWQHTLRERNGRGLFTFTMQATEHSARIDVRFLNDFTSPKTHCILRIDNLETGQNLEIDIGIRPRSIPFLDIPEKRPYIAQAVPLGGRGLEGTYEWELSGPGRLASATGAQNTLYCTGPGDIRIRLYNGTERQFFRECELTVLEPDFQLQPSDPTIPLSMDGNPVRISPLYFTKDKQELPRSAFDEALYAELLALQAVPQDSMTGRYVQAEPDDGGIRLQVTRLLGENGESVADASAQGKGYLLVGPRYRTDGQTLRLLVRDPFGWTEDETREFDNYMFICRDFAGKNEEIVLGDNSCHFRNDNGSGIRYVGVEYDGATYLTEGAAALHLRAGAACIHTVLDAQTWQSAAARWDFRGPGWLRYHIRNRHSGELFYSALLHFHLIVHLGIACKIRRDGDGHWYLVPVWCMDADKIPVARNFTSTFPYPVASRKENWPALTNALFWNPLHDEHCCIRDFEEMQVCFNGYGAKARYGKYVFDVTSWCEASQNRTFLAGSAADGAYYGPASHFGGDAADICRLGNAFSLLNFLNPSIIWPPSADISDVGKHAPYYLYLHNYTYH